MLNIRLGNCLNHELNVSARETGVEGSLLEAEEGFNVAFVHAGDEAEVGEVAFLLLCLLGQDVALEGMFSLDFS